MGRIVNLDNYDNYIIIIVMHTNVNKFKHMFIIIISIIRCSLVIDSCALVNTYTRRKKKHTHRHSEVCTGTQIHKGKEEES